MTLFFIQEISTTPVKTKPVSCPVEVIDMCGEEDNKKDKLINSNDEKQEEICNETGDYHLVSIISHTGGSSRFGKSHVK